MIVDAMGNVRAKGLALENQVFNSSTVDVSQLEVGLYSVITNLFGEVGRFVKM